MVIIEAESPESDSIIVPESQSVPAGSRAFTPNTEKNRSLDRPETENLTQPTLFLKSNGAGPIGWRNVLMCSAISGGGART
jgi:hypothetical protein